MEWYNKVMKEKIPGYDRIVIPYHLLRAGFAGVKYGFPGKKLRVIGVTGTNGKTTTAFMIWKMLNNSGRKAGVMTTVGWGVEEIYPELKHMTTADVMVLNRRMKQIVAEGAEFLVLEVTSHALAQFRVLGIPIEIGVLTNVTHEHLDYHRTFERYLAAKMKLFKRAKFGVVNRDDENEQKVVAEMKKLRKKYITYGIKNGDLRADRIKLGVSGVEYACGDIKIKTKIPGKFNVYNSLAAVAVGRELGLSDKEIVDGIAELLEVEGRMNRVDKGQNFEVIVDYAHTPDAFLKVFEAVSEKKGRIITVTGGAGRRDITTRAMRGEIAGQNSRLVVITEDDSRDESPEGIAEAFVSGVKKTKAEVVVELDRRRAIELALRRAKSGEVVLVLGKGHEKTILRKEGPVEFEDLKVVSEILEGMKKKK